MKKHNPFLIILSFTFIFVPSVFAANVKYTLINSSNGPISNSTFYVVISDPDGSYCRDNGGKDAHYISDLDHSPNGDQRANETSFNIDDQEYPRICFDLSYNGHYYYSQFIVNNAQQGKNHTIELTGKETLQYILDGKTYSFMKL